MVQNYFRISYLKLIQGRGNNLLKKGIVSTNFTINDKNSAQRTNFRNLYISLKFHMFCYGLF